MRLTKQSLVLLFITAFACSLFVTSQAYAQTGTFVYDTMDLLSTEEFQQLEALGRDYAEKYDMGVYLLTTSDMGPDQSSAEGRNEFARSRYLEKNLGVGSGKDGILLVIASSARKYVTIKHISQKDNDPFSNSGVSAMESDVKEHLSDNEWDEAAQTYYEEIGQQLDYYKENGVAWSESGTFFFLIKVGTTIAIPLMIAFAVVRSGINAMKTARKQVDAEGYETEAGLQLTYSSDDFQYRTTNVVPIPKDKGRSSSGGWSDMGGGFSGSGGGDF